MTASPDDRPESDDEKRTAVLPADVEAESEDLYLGRDIDGRYQVLERIGVGGMSWVYRATQIPIGRMVALKVLRPDRRADSRHVKRFEDEARLAGSLGHPNAVTVHDAGRFSDGTHFIAMDLLTGRNLRRLLEAEGALPEARVRDIIRQVVDAVAEAHRRGFVHSDLKPENVMIEPDRMGHAEWVQVLDFGIAVPSGSPGASSSSAMPSQILGTPRYMSPEQCRGESLDARSDIYSIGVVMYEMLVGEPPFHGGNVTTGGPDNTHSDGVRAHHAVGSATSVMAKHVQGGVPPMRERRPDLELTREFEKLVMRALSKDPNWRFRDGEEMLEAFDGLHRLETAAERSMERPHRSSTMPRAAERPTRKAGATRRFPGVGLGLLSIAAVAGIALYFAFSGPTDEASIGAPRTLSSGFEDAALAGSGPGVVDTRTLLQDAREQLSNGRPAAASEIYDRVRRLEPNQVEAWVGLGRAARGLQQPEQALFYFARAHKIAERVPDQRWPRHLLDADREEREIRELNRLTREARQASRAGDSPTAIARYREYVHGRPWDLTARLALGRLLVDGAFLEEAAEQFAAAVRLDPIQSEPHFELGLAWLALDRPAEAETELEVAVRLDPGSEEAQRALERARFHRR